MPTPAQPVRIAEPTQCASRVLMVRPGSFARNEAAAESNAFMRAVDDPSNAIADTARREFDGLAQALTDAGVEVVIDPEPDLPDSVFPNNWFSYHEPAGSDPVLITYPMATPARRRERRESTIARITALAPSPPVRIALESLEEGGEHLEGTGSLVIDRVNAVGFACRSPRTTDAALDRWISATGAEIERFDAVDAAGTPVYHTNVIASIGDAFALIVSGSITDNAQRARVLARLRGLRASLIDLDPPQIAHMCANIIELRSTRGEPLIAMSRTAWDGFTPAQRRTIEGLATPVVADIPTIERVGGGSVRCMIAELGRSRLTRSE